MKRAYRVWIRIFPDVPVSKKPTEVRMGKGKGSPEFWAAKVKPGLIMFEIDGAGEPVAREAPPRRDEAADQDQGRRPPRRFLAPGRRMMAANKNSGRVEDMRTKTDDELTAELSQLKREQFNLRFQAASGQLENTARVRQVRRDIARVQTIARQKSAVAKA